MANYSNQYCGWINLSLLRHRIRWFLSGLLALVSLDALADTPYLSFASEFTFASKNAVALDAHERERVHAVVRLIYSHLPKDLTCPELVGSLVASGGGRATEKLQRRRLAYLRDMLEKLGIEKSAFVDEVAPSGASYAPENINVIELEGRLNIRWSQTEFSPTVECVRVLRR